MYSELTVGKPSQKSLRRPGDNIRNVARGIVFDGKWVERAGFCISAPDRTGLIT
jgi:hypothetical protein